MRWRLLPGLAALLLALGPVGGAATAAPVPAATPEGPRGRVSEVVLDDDSVRFLLTARGLDPGTAIDPGSVRATLGGEALAADVSPVDEGPESRVRRVAVLAMDLSDSMREALPAAKEAATDFVRTLPDDVAVGLVTFSDEVDTIRSPTTDRDRVVDDIAALAIVDKTRLYDGIVRAVEVAGTSGERTVVVLTDGQDTGGDTSLEDVTTTVADSGVRVDAVPLGNSADFQDELGAITEAGQGSLFQAAEAGDLADAFAEAAASIAAQVVVTAPLPAALAGAAGRTVTLAVQAEADGTFISTDASVALPEAPAQAAGPVPVPVDGPTLGPTWLVAGVGGLFAGLAVLLGTALVTAGGPSRETRVLRRMSLYTLTGRSPRRQETITSLGGSGIARTAVQLAGRVVARRDYETRLMRRLDSAGVPVRPAEWVILHTASTIVGGLVFLLLGGGAPLTLLLGLLVGGLLPVGYLSVMQARRQAAFSAQLADTLMLIAGSLGAGYSMPQAVDAVVREGREPVASELNRALVETRLGVPLEEALEHLAERMRSRDFSWVVMAMRIQREVGGNLSEVLRSVADTMRERDFLRRQISALSAEGRLSALVLSLLPPFFVTYLAIVRPEYLSLLLTNVVGLAMVVVGVTLLVVGLLWMRRIIRVEV